MEKLAAKMAARTTLVKLKQHLNLPLRFLRNPVPVLTRPVAPFARPDSPSAPLPLFGPSTLARHMATARSPRGASRTHEEDDDDDVGDEVDFDSDDEFMDHVDSDCSVDGDAFEYEDDEEEMPRGKKKGFPKDW